MIIPALHDRQKQRGYLTRNDMRTVAEECGVPLHRVHSVVSFFPHFRTDPPPTVQVDVCRDMACHLRGSVKVANQLRAWAQRRGSDDVEVCGVSCLGRCDRAIAAMVNEKLVATAGLDRLKDAVRRSLAGKSFAQDSDWDTIRDSPKNWDLDYDKGQRSYENVRRFACESGNPQIVIDSLKTASLLGMGGAGGRAYLKWDDVRKARGKTGDKYIVCNADESEPGTFKDREILLAAPHTVVEGMIIAAMVVGARKGWIYIRHEYHEQIVRCRDEIAHARSVGALGNQIFDSRYAFDLEVFPSPGGYICGEQTALIEAMEDKRAEPRNRPPELMTNGLHDQPTLLSNVETFAWVPAILTDEGSWFSKAADTSAKLVGGAADRMTGKRLFSISGDVQKPGVYEVSTGITLGQLIDDHCEGMLPGKSIAAVALSGPSGGLLPPQIPIEALDPKGLAKCEGISERTETIDIRDLPLDIQVSRALGYMLGAGIVIYGTGCDVLAEAVANSRFYRNESCGKCVPCRIGSQKITEMGEQLLSGKLDGASIDKLLPIAGELASVMQTTSICGLGQVAANPMQSFLRFFPHLLQEAGQ